jgi:hypothetical protein
LVPMFACDEETILWCREVVGGRDMLADVTRRYRVQDAIHVIVEYTR